MEENQANVDLRIGATVVQHKLNPVLHKEQQTTESLLNNGKNLPEWKKVPMISSGLDIDNVPKTTILAIFSKAESLLNEKRGINKGASTDERLTIVKDKTSVQLFIVALTGRNRDVLTCKCKTFLRYNFCNHSVSVACELNIWLAYFVVVRKKHRNNAGKSFVCSNWVRPFSKRERHKKRRNKKKCHNKKKEKFQPSIKWPSPTFSGKYL